MRLRITVLGSGTSSGVPTIGCSCAVCHSTDPRDNRLRPSILITLPAPEGDRNIVIDTTPDFRTQVLRAKVTRLDAIVYTHAHADHILGLDDVRPFNYHQGGRIPIYTSEKAFTTIRRVFSYVFEPHEGKTAIPQVEVNLIGDAPFDVLGLSFQPVPLIHGRETIYGYRFGNVAYLTDHNEIPEASLPLLQGLDVLFLDALRHRPHPTHTTVAEATQRALKIGAKQTWFTHMCHDVPHAETQASLPPGIFLAYDGLEIEVNRAA